MRTYLGLAWASVRHRPGGWLLLALGVALASVLPVISAGLRAESSVAAVHSVIDGLPPAKRAALAVTFRDVRGTALADIDHTVRAGFSSAGITDVNRTLTFRPLSAGAQSFTLGGVDDLPDAVRLTSGRLPASCQPKACEVVVVTVPSGAKPAESYDRAARQLGLVVTGTAELIDQRPTGTGLIAVDTPLLLAADPTALADLDSLSLFGRNTAWYGTLDGRSIASLGAARFTRVLADISEGVNASSGPLAINWPSEAVIAASDRATAGTDQLAVLGAGSGSLLLGFGLVVAAGMRRRQQLVGRLLTRRGASTQQILLTTALQPLFAVVVGVLAGAAAGVAVVGLRGRELLAEPWVAAVDAVRSEWPALVGLGLAAIVITVAVALWPEESRRSTQLVVDAALLAAVAATVLIVVSSSQGSAGPLTASVVVLVTIATGLVAARLWRPLAALASRRRSGHITWAAALAGGRRRPLLSMVTAAFVAAACCSLVFAGAYQQSLRQSALDQAAQQVPLDVSVSASAQVAVPSDVVDTEALRAISDQVQIYPVVRSTVTAFAGSSLASALPLTGVDPQALPGIHEFAATTGTKLSPTELAGRLSADNGGSNGPVIPAGTRRLSVPARGANSDIVVGVWVGTGNGREFMIPLAEHGSDLIAELDGTQELTVRAVEVAESASFQTHRQHGVGEGQNDRGLATGDLSLGRMEADGRPLDWSWAAWGSDRATVSATEGSLSVHYQIGETRVVVVPGFASLAAAPPLAVAVDTATAARASATGDFGITVNGRTLPAKIVAVLPRLPGVGDSFVLADRAAVTAVLSRIAPGTAYVSQLWIAAPVDKLDQVRAVLAGSPAVTATLTYRSDLARTISGDPVATRSILLLSLAGVIALLLAAVSCAAAVRANLDESAAEHLALELDGLGPASLRRVLLIRAGLVLGLGVLVGVLGGLVLAAVAVRLVVTGPGGTAVIPPLRVVVAAGPTVAVIAAAALLGLAGCLLVAISAFRSPLPRMPEVDLR